MAHIINFLSANQIYNVPFSTREFRIKMDQSLHVQHLRSILDIISGNDTGKRTIFISNYLFFKTLLINFIFTI